MKRDRLVELYQSTIFESIDKIDSAPEEALRRSVFLTLCLREYNTWVPNFENSNGRTPTNEESYEQLSKILSTSQKYHADATDLVSTAKRSILSSEMDSLQNDIEVIKTQLLGWRNTFWGAMVMSIAGAISVALFTVLILFLAQLFDVVPSLSEILS